MAQQRKRIATRRGKTVKRGKAPKGVKAAQRKAAKRRATKAKSRTVPTRAKGPVGRVPAPKKEAPRKRRGELPIEVVRVETVEEPTPGVVVVKAHESVRVRRPTVTAEADELPTSAGVSESNGK